MEKMITSRATEINREALSETDRKLLELVESHKNRIRIVGVGGSGCNTLSRMSEFTLEDTRLIAANSDAQSLLHTVADQKILLGKGPKSGRGAGGDVAVGEKHAIENAEELRESLKGAKVVFMTTGLGGGTGTGAAPVVAQAAKANNAICVAIVTLPFRSEGTVTNRKAVEGVKKLSNYADTIIVLQNNKLLELAPDLPLNSAFGMIDRFLAETIQGLIDMVMKPGVVNQDLANLMCAFRHGGLAVMGSGDSVLPTENERVLEATELALKSPLLEEADLSTANRVLINISAGQMVTLDNTKEAMRYIMSHVSSQASLYWGVHLDTRIPAGKTKVTVVACGVKRIGDVRLDAGWGTNDAIKGAFGSCDLDDLVPAMA